jgi:hypothetical protein
MWILWLGNVSTFLRTVFNQNKKIINLIFLLLNWFLVALKITQNNKIKFDNSIINFEWEKSFSQKGFLFSLIDTFFLLCLNRLFRFKNSLKKNFYVTSKISQLDNNKFYTFNNKENFNSTLQLFLYGLRSVWKHLRFWILPLTFMILFVYYSFFLRSLPFSKVIFAYILIGNMFYLLISGFVFFIKHYQYRLYTSVIQRFWRRTLIIFWAIEGSLFTCFFYLIINASQEPIYMYDNIQIYKTHFYSWRYFLSKIFLSALVIVLVYILLLSIKWNTFTKTNNIALLITVILLYISWLEFYQLFHLMNCYGNSNWVYDFSEHLWNLELEFKRTRIVNHYVTIGLVAKFWHVVFAVVFWIFFLLRGLESSRYRYPLLAANLQNFLIIYIMSWLYMYPWFKYSIRKILDVPYFWFFVNNRRLGVFLFFNDIKLFFWGLIDLFTSLFNNNFFFKKNSFFYWHESSLYLNNTQFRKHNIRDVFIRSLIN